MKRSVLTTAAGLIFVLSMTGCGGGEPDVPDGHSMDEVRTPTDNPQPPPGRDMEGPEKGGDG